MTNHLTCHACGHECRHLAALERHVVLAHRNDTPALRRWADATLLTYGREIKGLFHSRVLGRPRLKGAEQLARMEGEL